MLSPRALRYRTEFERAASRWRMLPLVLASHMDVESETGESKLLDIPGPEGTGDHVPRKGQHYANNLRYEPLALPNGTVGYMPADGRGWGRGLMQLDYEWQPDFCDEVLPEGGFAWEDPQLNLYKGAEVWARNFAFLRDMEATICAYNAGAAAAHGALAGLTLPFTVERKVAALDAVTAAPHHYVTVVLARLKEFRA